jgi:4-hydroxy-3-polyprenylbenzoate decarboxylase
MAGSLYPDLQSFIAALERAGELMRIQAEVSPILEIAAITDRVSKSSAPNGPSKYARACDPAHFGRGGPALLFERVKGCDLPVLINAFGSYRRMEMALGCTEGGFSEIADRIADLVKPQPPRGIGEALGKAKQFAPLLKIGPKMSGRGACQEVVVTGNDVDLTRLPLIRCWPLDGDFAGIGYPPEVNDGVESIERGAAWEANHRGRYITLAGVHTIHADDAGKPKPSSHNIGMYRVQLLGPRTMAMHWHVHHDGAAHWRSWKRRGEPMPVAIVLGGPAVLPYAATAPLPPGISELLMAGFLNGKGLRLVEAKTVPLRVPADAEIVIEGYVSHEAGPIGWDPRDDDAGPLGPGAVFEGPFGDHTGFYSMPDRYPLLNVTAVTRRREAVYPTTIVGLPPQEDYYLGKATERIFLPLLKTLIHDIEDYHLPMFGAFHNCAFIKIKKQYPLQARRVMHAVWGAGQMAWTKSIFVVDEDVDVHDLGAVMRACSERCDPVRDIERVRGPLDILDHAAPRIGAGMKIGFDCTRFWPGEEAGRGPGDPGLLGPARREAAISAARATSGVARAEAPEELGGWLLASADSSGDDAFRLARMLANLTDALPFTVLLGPHVDVSTPDEALFHWVANCDASRDLIVQEHDGGGRLVFDATPKRRGPGRNGEPIRAWPPLIQVDSETRAKVDRRWADYGFGAGGTLTQPPRPSA